MLKRVTWRSWALPGALLAVFLVLGLTWHASGSTENWIYKVGTLGATFAPLLLTGIYTASGNKWWANDLGTALVQSLLSIVVIAAPLCWAIWVDGGMINGGLLAWLEIAGPLLAAVTILRLSYVFARIHREGNGEDAAREDATPLACGHRCPPPSRADAGSGGGFRPASIAAICAYWAASHILIQAACACCSGVCGRGIFAMWSRACLSCSPASFR